MIWRFPPEWHPQDWLWIGFPHDAEEWPGYLEAAQAQIAAFASAVAESGQAVRLLVRDAANEAHASRQVTGKVALERRTYGDVRPGEFLALVNSFGVLEIARAEQSAAEALGLGRGAPVTVSEP